MSLLLLAAFNWHTAFTGTVKVCGLLAYVMIGGVLLLSGLKSTFCFWASLVWIVLGIFLFCGFIAS